MFNSGNGNGMGWGTRRQPVEEQRDFTQETEVAIPIRQAISAGIAAGYAIVVAPVIAMVAVGESVFWLIAGVWGFATFWWYLRRSSALVTEDNRPVIEVYGESVSNSLSWLEIIAGICMSVFAGGISLCFWKVLYPIIPERSPWFSGWVFTLLGIAQLPAAIVTAALLIMAFTLELAQRSPWQEQHMWAAFADIVRGFGLKAVQEWWREPVLVNVRERNGTRTVEIQERPAPTEAEKDAAIITEFIERGSKGRGFARDAWVGKDGAVLKASGGTLSRTLYESITERLIAANLLEDRGKAGKHLLCSAEEAIKYVVG